MPALTWRPRLPNRDVVDIITTRVNFFRCHGPVARSWEIGIEKLRRRRAKVANVLGLVTCIDYVLNGFRALFLTGFNQPRSPSA